MTQSAGGGPFTQGFRTHYHLAVHFGNHGWELNVADELIYQTLADRFLGGPRTTTTDECIRTSDQARIRYDHVSQEYGVLAADGFILTYMIPDPAVHGLPSNYDYFLDDCRGRRRQ